MSKILVIDDSMITRKHLKKFLEERGHEVFTASSGEEGLQMLPTTLPDGIILDQLMPGMEGVEVLARLSEMGSKLPVIVLTADTQNTTRQTLVAAGAADVLPKPPQSERLLQVLEKLL